MFAQVCSVPSLGNWQSNAMVAVQNKFDAQVCSVLGTPSSTDWSQGHQLAHQVINILSYMIFINCY